MDTKALPKMHFILLSIAVIIPSVLSYGFDGGASCTPKMARRGRAQLVKTIPCDLSTQAYCNLPGSAYPWHAVRRFVHENQGLMRRMYGDVRHISILRTEIDTNDIELDDAETTAARYSRSGFRKDKYLHSEIQNAKNNDVLTEPHFRPASTTTTTTKAPTTRATTTHRPDDENNEVTFENAGVAHTGTTGEAVSFSVYDNITETSSGSDGIHIIRAPDLSQSNQSESSTISSTLRIVVTAKVEEPTTRIDIDETTPETVDIITSSSQDRFDDFNDEDEEKINDGVISVTEKFVAQQNERFSENSPETKKANRPAIQATATMESQLYQDVAHKDPPPVANLKGVNACPVKEEVVAPFWANNTRGEVLALLNLYPFEQYVHWEKCTHENKQMYCRDGCRCEQQYRLHRLLAYDPHNECRGIFSDWFRFPSCCICKCYDIPFEYRVTSRSPRSMPQEKHPADVAEDEVQRAIYEHATEDWYRPRDDFEWNE